MKALAVFCGSRSGKDPLYMTHARQLGERMAQHGITLIYGGGSVGLMGAVADGVMDAGGKVIGVIPEVLMAWEQDHKNITELKVVADMHVRKKLMYELCDAAVILPGGFGTLDELFEMLTWNQLNIHDKRIFVLNTSGFYDAMLAHARVMEDQEFLYDKLEDRITVVSDVDELFRSI